MTIGSARNSTGCAAIGTAGNSIREAARSMVAPGWFTINHAQDAAGRRAVGGPPAGSRWPCPPCAARCRTMRPGARCASWCSTCRRSLGPFTERLAALRKLTFAIPSGAVGDSRRTTARHRLRRRPAGPARQDRAHGRRRVDAASRRVPLYRGERNNDLLKFKPYDDADARVVAHLPGKGRNANRVGALMVESPDGRRFRLGSGLTDAVRDAPPPVGAWVSYAHNGTNPSGLPSFARFMRVSGGPGLTTDQGRWRPARRRVSISSRTGSKSATLSITIVDRPTPSACRSRPGATIAARRLHPAPATGPAAGRRRFR